MNARPKQRADSDSNSNSNSGSSAVTYSTIINRLLFFQGASHALRHLEDQALGGFFQDNYWRRYPSLAYCRLVELAQKVVKLMRIVPENKQHAHLLSTSTIDRSSQLAKLSKQNEQNHQLTGRMVFPNQIGIINTKLGGSK